MLRIEQLQVAYGETLIIRGVDLEVGPGQVVCLMGRNGVGKTTLLKCLMGLLPVRSGDMEFDGRSIAGMPPYARAALGMTRCQGQVGARRSPPVARPACCAPRRTWARRFGVPVAETPRVLLACPLSPGPRLERAVPCS